MNKMVEISQSVGKVKLVWLWHSLKILMTLKKKKNEMKTLKCQRPNETIQSTGPSKLLKTGALGSSFTIICITLLSLAFQNLFLCFCLLKMIMCYNLFRLLIFIRVQGMPWPFRLCRLWPRNRSQPRTRMSTNPSQTCFRMFR